MPQTKTPALVIVFTVLWLALSAASYFIVVVPTGNRFDFYPRHVGANDALRGINPYAEPTTLRIQEGMFGSVLPPDADQQRFAYNAFIVWLLLPFWLLPFPISVSLWLGLQLLLLFALPLLAFQMLGWRLQPAILVLVILCSAFGYRYPMVAYVIGQFITLMLGGLILVWWGIHHKNNVALTLGILFLAVRPEVVVFPALLLAPLIWFSDQRRVLWIGAGILAGLWLLTRLWIGAWVVDFIKGIRAYQEYSFPVWAPGLFGHQSIAVLIVMLTIAWASWMLWQIIRQPTPTRQTGWLLAVAIVVGLILTPITGNYAMILGLLVFWVVLWAFRHHKLYFAVALAAMFTPWLFHGQAFVTWETLVIPVLLGGLLTWGWHYNRQQLAILQ